jgi:hypothetical protein
MIVMGNFGQLIKEIYNSVIGEIKDSDKISETEILEAEKRLGIKVPEPLS